MAERDYLDESAEYNFYSKVMCLNFGDFVVLVVAFIPSEECNEAIINDLIELTAYSIDISTQYGGKAFSLNSEKDFENVEKFISVEKLHFTCFLVFDSMSNLEKYLERMKAEDIF